MFVCNSINLPIFCSHWFNLNFTVVFSLFLRSSFILCHPVVSFIHLITVNLHLVLCRCSADQRSPNNSHWLLKFPVFSIDFTKCVFMLTPTLLVVPFLCVRACRVSFAVPPQWVEPHRFSERRRPDGVAFRQWEQHSAEQQHPAAAVHTRLLRPSSHRPTVRQGGSFSDSRATLTFRTAPRFCSFFNLLFISSSPPPFRSRGPSTRTA